MKVLMFGWEFPPFNSGGLGVACYGLTKALANRNVEVTFVLPKEMPLESPFLRFVFADKMNGLLVNSLLSPYLTSQSYSSRVSQKVKHTYGLTLFEEVKRYALLARQIALEEHFDVIHSHDWLSFEAGIAAKEATGKPLIAHVHATEFDRGGNENINPIVYSIERKGMKEADKIIAVSNFTKEKIVKHYGISPEKIEIVYNAIDKVPPPAVSPLLTLKEKDEKLVIFVGRITLQKGPDYFLRAARKVLQYDPHVLFVMAGSGDMERQMMEQAAAWGIADKVIFSGFLRDDELDALYQTADLFVLPSVSEPFGITVLEALRNGTPALISKQSGVSEVIAHCLKVDFWDVDQMAAKILAVLAYPPLKSALKTNGGQEVKKLSWQDAAAKCIQIYQTFLTPAV